MDPIAKQEHGQSAAGLGMQLDATRSLTLAIAAPLSDADATVQSMPDASPAKWHLAHTTWFFETFILRDHVQGYRLFDDRWPYLFNSYYEAEGARIARDRRGMLSRPSLREIADYRAHVDAALASALPGLGPTARDLVALGIQHEQQHQELLVTDIKHMLHQNPLGPALWPDMRVTTARPVTAAGAASCGWISGPSGIVAIGATDEGFAFDCERPVHQQMLTPFALARRTVTNGEWMRFIEDRGYQTASLWLADGWAWVQHEQVRAPLYWRLCDEGWEHFTLSGWQPVDPDAPVAHISLYEADAFATWAGARLPTEAEWEAIACTANPASGNQMDAAGPVAPAPAPSGAAQAGMFGDIWTWTGSAYRPYPRHRTADGAIGEYNGKFMSGQFVLKGASCATPRGHSRASYRNFFYPHQRWQFTGLRLAKDV